MAKEEHFLMQGKVTNALARFDSDNDAWRATYVAAARP